MERLKASAAKELSKANDPESVVESILSRVEKAANEGNWKVQIRDFGFGSNVYYSGPNEWPSAGKAVIHELRKLGYAVDIRCEDRQFVDIFLEVSWV